MHFRMGTKKSKRARSREERKGKREENKFLGRNEFHSVIRSFGFDSGIGISEFGFCRSAHRAFAALLPTEIFFLHCQIGDYNRARCGCSTGL
jgi:hypothetical protein